MPYGKLPELRCELVHRAQLVVEDFSNLPALTVLNGGAGFGKSVVLMEQARLAREAGEHVVHVYMRPNESGIFDIYRRVRQNLEAQGIVRPGDMPDEVPSGAHDLAFTAVRRLDRRLVVLVDNVRELDGPHLSIPRAFANVLESLPRMHAILAGRELSSFRSDEYRLRVGTRIIEENELAMSRAEIEELCVYAAKGSPAVNVRTFAEKLDGVTQGWPLAVSAVVSQVAQADVWTANGIGSALTSFTTRYLADTASDLSEDEKRLLLAVGEMSEASPGLLAKLGLSPGHILGDSAASALIARRLDPNGDEWFRVRTALGPRLAERMRADLGKQETRRINALIASELRHEQPTSAFRAALLAGDLELANGIVCDSLADMLWGMEQEDAQRLGEIPEALLQGYPILNMIQVVGSIGMARGRILRNRGLIAELEKSLRTDSVSAGMVGVTAAASRLRLAGLQGDADMTERMLYSVDEQVAALSRSEAERGARSLCAIGVQLAAAELRLLKFDAAIDRCQQTVYAASLSGVEEIGAHAAALQALGAALQGDMVETEALIARFEDEFPPVHGLPNATRVDLGLANAILQLERGQFAEAGASFRELQHEELVPEYWTVLTWFQAVATESASGAEEALSWLGRRIQSGRLDFSSHPAIRLYFEEFIGRLKYQTERLVLAPEEEGRDDFIGLNQARSSGNLERALTVATLIASEAREVGNTRRTIAALLVKAEVLRWRLDPAFRETWDEARNLCERNALTTPLLLFPRASLFDEAVEKGDDVLSGSVSGIVALSKAELRALRQVAVSGNAVAAAKVLFLSPHTVRAQLKSCYRKLKVANRSEALLEAARIGILHAGTRPPSEVSS